MQTSSPQERTCFLESVEDLSKPDDDYDDIAMGNMLSRYTNRPQSLGEITLVFDETIEDTTRQNHACQRGQKLPSKQKVLRVLRSVRYNPDTHLEEFSREHIMLYTNWRNEDSLIGSCNSSQERYKELQEQIALQLQNYEPHAAQVDLAEVQATEAIEEQWNNLAPSTEHENQIDQESELLPSDDHMFINPPANMPQYNMRQDLGVIKTADKRDMMPFDEMSDKDHRALIRSLNEKQREFFCNIHHQISVK